MASNIAYIDASHERVICNPEAEQQVLGALMMDANRIHTVIARGDTPLFFDPVHARIFEEMKRREKDGMLASPVALRNWAAQDEGLTELGGAAYLVRLMAHSVMGSQVADYCDILADLRDKRMIFSAMEVAREELFRGEVKTAVVAGRLESALSAASIVSGPKPTSMRAAVNIAVQQAIAARDGDDQERVQTGIEAVDRMMSGLYPGDLILLGGRPSMGKTSVALNVALNAARAGHGVVICSLEMNPEAMALRALSESTARVGRAISYRDIRAGNFHGIQAEVLRDAAEEVSNLPITFLSREYSDLGALLAGARQAKRMMGDNFKLLIVDYAQLLRSKAANRYEQITEISIALKNLAGQMNVPVLALSQLSRSLEQRDDKRPMLSDLRESGQLEQDADAVLFCYRDEYYLEREQPDTRDLSKYEAWEAAMNAARNHLEIIIAKQRQGPIGTANVMCNVALNRIWEM